MGVPASTLRLYSVRFARLLSVAAATPQERAGGRPGFRLYSERDLAILKEGKALLARGLTYDEALRELRGRWAQREPRGETRRRAAVAPPTPDEATGSGGSVAAGDAEERRAVARELTILPATLGLVGREEDWSALVAQLLAALGGAQSLAEEWRRVVGERNEEIGALRERLERCEAEKRRPWWQRMFGG